MNMLFRNLLIFLSLVLYQSSYAQPEGGSGAGNGGGEDAEFQFIKCEEMEWLIRNDQNGSLDSKLEFGLNGYSVSEMVTQLMDKMLNVQPIFNDESIEIDGQVRVCRNVPTENKIYCNITQWNRTLEHIKYAIVLHEYLGLLLIEPNILGYSQYPISKNILKFTYLDQRYELGNALRPQLPECRVKDEWFWVMLEEGKIRVKMHTFSVLMNNQYLDRYTPESVFDQTLGYKYIIDTCKAYELEGRCTCRY